MAMVVRRDKYGGDAMAEVTHCRDWLREEGSLGSSAPNRSKSRRRAETRLPARVIYIVICSEPYS